jgi:hypothetical protein
VNRIGLEPMFRSLTMHYHAAMLPHLLSTLHKRLVKIGIL